MGDKDGDGEPLGRPQRVTYSAKKVTCMSRKVIKALNSTDGKRRILFFQRPDGYFGLVEQYWYQDCYEGKLIAEGWVPRHTPSSIFETLEIAEREAKAHYHWLTPWA